MPNQFSALSDSSIMMMTILSGWRIMKVKFQRETKEYVKVCQGNVATEKHKNEKQGGKKMRSRGNAPVQKRRGDRPITTRRES